MRRTALLAVVLSLVVAPAALGKGPHASLSPLPESVEPGRPWVATLSLFEFARRDADTLPTLIAENGATSLRAEVRPLSAHVPRHADVMAELRYRVRLFLPDSGPWKITVLDGTPADRRFVFTEGVDIAPPEGSRPRPEPALTGGGPLEPRVYTFASGETADGGGLPLWALPLGGLALVASAAAAVRRRARRAP